MCIGMTILKESWHCQFKQWYSVPTRAHYHPGPILLFCSVLFLKSGLQCQARVLSGGAGLSNPTSEQMITHISVAPLSHK